MSVKVTLDLSAITSALTELDDRTTAVCVACPGIAHERREICLVCDEETDGSIEINMTVADQEALARAAQGLPTNASLALRLARLGLLEKVERTFVPTARGYQLLGDISPITIH